MKRFWIAAAAAAVSVSWSLSSFASDDVQDQLRAMQDRMAALEDELRQEKSRSEEQQQTLERAGLAEMDEFSVKSSLSSFIEQTEIGGWVAASYWYNTNNIDSDSLKGSNTGLASQSNPFRPDSNTFQLDQVWFEIFKPATEESRGGFGVELAFGKTADVLRGDDDGNGDAPVVYQGYVEYLAPIGPGLNIKAGRFATLIGAEVAQTVYNFNITRGLVYNLMQPINHVGALASMELDNGLDFAVGIANTAVDNLNSDDDDDKAFLWRVGYSADAWSVGVNGLYGGNAGDAGAGRNGDKTGIVDVVATWDPSEALSMWANFDYVWLDGEKAPGDPQAVGIAVAGRYAITEQAGFALRGEYVYSEDDYIGLGVNSSSDQDLWSITGTLDYLLTENLTARAEVRYEQGDASSAPNDFYFGEGDGSDPEKNQVLLGVEMYYRF